MYNYTNQGNNPTARGESYVEFYIVFCVLNALFSLTAFAGNFLVLGAIWRTPSLHQPINILLFGMSLSDLGVGLIIQPMFVAVVTYEVSTGRYPSDLWMMFRPIQAVFVSATLLTLTSVSVDRCLALLLHLKYVAMVTVKKTIIVLCVIWVTSIMYGLTVIIDRDMHRVIVVCVVVLCIVVNVSTYSTIYRICRRHRIQIQNQAQVQQDPEALDLKRYKKSLITMIVLLILLILCYFPYIFTRAVAHSANWSPSYRSLMVRWSASLVYLNSSVNPLVFCWRLPGMRIAMKEYLQSLIHRHAI